MIDVLRFAVFGAAAGSVLALLAVGVNVIHRASRVVNFSHAATAIAAAYLYGTFSDAMPTTIAILLAIAVAAAIGAVTEIAVMRPMRHASALARAIGTIGVLLVIQSLLNIAYGTGPIIVPPWLPTDVIELGPVAVGLDRVLIIVIAVVVTAILYLVYRRTSFGIASVALASSERSLAALGRWRPRTVSLLNWTLAGALAGFAGVLVGPITVLNPTLCLTLAIPMLTAALLGNFASFAVTLGGAVALGIAQAEIGRLELFQGASDVLPFIVIVVVLALRGSALPQRGDDAERLPVIGSGRIPWVTVAVAAGITLVLVTVVLPEQWVTAVTAGLVSAIVLLSLVVVTGYAGQLSLASFGLAGIAALVAAQLVANAGWSFLPAALVGILATAPAGLLVGLPAVRTRGASLAIVTLGLAVVLQTAVFNNPALSGGFSGLSLGRAEIFGLDVSGVFEPRRYAVLVIVVFVAAGLAVLNIRRSSAGRRMVAVRGNERAAASLGIGVAQTKLYAFVVSAVIAGTGGVLIAFTNTAISLGNPGGRFDPTFSLNAIAQSTVGGVGFVGGTIVGTATEPGAVVSKLLLFLTSGPWFTLIGAVLLLVTVVTAPSGVVPNLLRLLGARRRRKPRPSTPIAAEPVEPIRERDTVLRVDGLGVAFGGNRALTEVTLEVVSGQVLGVIGPNGAGKTTLVDAITGYTRSHTGEVRLDGTRIDRWNPARRARHGIGRSFQSLELFEDLTVRDNLLVASERGRWIDLLLAAVHPGQARLSPAALLAVERLGISDRLDVDPAELSYGERRLLAIARALAARPRVLLLDEPAAGLGADERAELAGLVRVLAADWNIGVLIIEHDVDLVFAVSDQVVALDFGRVIARGVPEDVRRDPAVLTAYIGTDEEVSA